MLHVGLDLSRKRVDTCLISECVLVIAGGAAGTSGGDARFAGVVSTAGS